MAEVSAFDLRHANDAPEPLARRIAQLLAEAGAGEPVGRHLAAAEHTVERLLRAQSTSRVSALDLLAADALATYAFELAADHPERIPELAAQAMARFAALASSAPLEVGAPVASVPNTDAL